MNLHIYIIIIGVSFTSSFEVCTKRNNISNKCCEDSRNLNGTCVLSGEEEIELILKDRENGIMEVNFELDSAACNISEYTIYLYVLQDYNSEQCSAVSDGELDKIRDYIKYKHSEFNLLTETDICRTWCHKNITTHFNYIFTGCYFVRIEKYIGRDIVSKTKYVETSYVKKTEADYEVFVYSESRLNDLNVQLEHPFLKDSNNLRIDVSCPTFDCPNFNCEISFHIFPPEEVRQNIIQEDSYSLEACSMPSFFCATNSKIPNLDCRYSNETHTAVIDCTFKGFSQGIYNVFLQLTGETTRCREDSIWGNCAWSYSANITATAEYKLDEQEGTDHSLFFYIMLIVLIIVGLLGGIFLFIIGKYYAKPKQKQIFGEEEELFMNTSKVFLLYARDCPLFMEMMSEFRNVLSTIGHFEVLDIYDRQQFTNVVSNNWLRESLLECKIVLILTESAAILNENRHMTTSVYKQQQDCLDNYFLEALRYINQDSSLLITSYKKLNVVKLEFDKNLYRSFQLINPYTRGELPSGFPEILADLKDMRVSYSLNEHEQLIFEKFLKKYEEYQKFFHQNPRYLEEIMKVKVQII